MSGTGTGDDPKAPLLLVVQDPGEAPITSEESSSILRSLATPNTACVLLGPLLCAVVCLCVRFDGMGTACRNMLAVMAWIFTWWMTEAVPMPVTSMSPLFLFPLFGIAGADDVAKSYMDDVIALVLGSFILALAVEHYNIHKRLALNITLIFCGEPVNPPLLLFGICTTTAFVSMWMHNVATAMLMMPVATGILQRLPSTSQGTGRCKTTDNFCRAVVLGVIYSTAVGGISTLTGTGVNLILVGMWKSYFPEADPISFSTWFFFAFPLALLLLFPLWGILCCFYIERDSARVLNNYLDKAHIKRELNSLGKMSFAEKMVLSIFSVLILLWMTRNLTDDIPGWGALFKGRVGDGTASVLMATLLFIIPNKRRKGEKLMDWGKCSKLPWKIVLLLGAGFAIADGVRSSGLAIVLSRGLDFLQSAPFWGIVPMVCLIASIITEFTSNNSTTTLLIPLLIQLAQTMHVHPLLLMVPGAIGAQFAYLLPTSTPSNIVGFTTGHIEMKDMFKTGLPLKVFGIIVVSFLMPTLGRVVFRTNRPMVYPQMNWQG